MNSREKAQAVLMGVHRRNCLSILGDTPRIFESPPLNSRLLNAIKKIAPHLHLREDEESQELWQLDQNAASYVEYQALKDGFGQFKPKRVLEIGPGMGRSLIYLTKRFNWSGCSLDVYESDGEAIDYSLSQERCEQTFCGDISSLREVLQFNGLDERVHVWDARDVSLGDLPHTYDLIYSFFGVGYHWKLEDYLEDLSALMHPGSSALFTMQAAQASNLDLPGFDFALIPLQHFWPVSQDLVLVQIRKIPFSLAT